MTDLAPRRHPRNFLANSIAEEAWRLNQIRARCATSRVPPSAISIGVGDKYQSHGKPKSGIETDGIEAAVIETVIARDQSKQLALMSLYGQRTQRAYENTKKELERAAWRQTKADRAAELEEARLLFQLADTQGLAYDPKKDGFVFSDCAVVSGRKPTGFTTRLILARKEPKETTGKEEQSDRNHASSGQKRRNDSTQPNRPNATSFCVIGLWGRASARPKPRPQQPIGKVSDIGEAACRFP